MESVPADFHFASREDEINDNWAAEDMFGRQDTLTTGKPEFKFYDGPPFCTGMPHYGHLLAGTVKDVVCRYKIATGHHVTRHAGWDTHGLPVEYEVDRELGITGPQDVTGPNGIGIKAYNAECRKIVLRYADDWRKIVTRTGRWIDFDKAYLTLNRNFMESCWWVFSELARKDRIYRGVKVMPYSMACCTPLSNFEAGENYQEVTDPAVYVTFPIIGDAEGAEFMAWTTTPWTLPSNLALCVRADMDYVRARELASGRIFVVGKSRLDAIWPKKKGEKSRPYEVLAELKGSDLGGLRYEPLYDYFKDFKGGKIAPHVVLMDDYVTDDSGTGVVHQAPYFGEEDYAVCLKAGVICADSSTIVCPLDESCRFTDEVPDFKGLNVKAADAPIMEDLKSRGRLFRKDTIKHQYPMCYRSDTPLIYRAVPSWFIRVDQPLRDRMVELTTNESHWVPQNVRDGRFKNWLANARDWAVSRNRFWGTPLPIWVNVEDEHDYIVIGSVSELEELTGSEPGSITDLHRDFVDDLVIRRDGKEYRRVPEVCDCWAESGSMPYAKVHYPFDPAARAAFEDGTAFPADFIAEGIDQCRGWFYTLTVLSVSLFDCLPYKNLIVFGLLLAEDKQKMSKRKKNYTDPMEIVHKHGADALRLYLINSPAVRAENLAFQDKGVEDVVRSVLIPWYSAYRFLSQQIDRAARDTGAAFVPAASTEALKAEVTSAIDKWILTEFAALVASIRGHMDGYVLYKVMPELLTFLDRLTNGYIRLCRSRLKGQAGRAECTTALRTLYFVLTHLCTVAAPFLPFITEDMYRNLARIAPAGMIAGYTEGEVQVPASVHLTLFPEVADLADEEAHRQVTHALEAIELGRTARENASLGLQQPLQKIVFAHHSEEFVADVNAFAVFVQGELKVREVEATLDESRYAELKLAPNHRALGRRLGKNARPVMKGLSKLGFEQAAEMRSTGHLEVAGFELTSEDVVLTLLPIKKLPADLSVSVGGTNNALVAAVTTTLTPELKAEGAVIRLYSAVMKARKNAALNPGQAGRAFIVSDEDAETVIEPLKAQLTSTNTTVEIVDALPTEAEPVKAGSASVVVLA